jgi:hypothetical protein
VAAACEERSVSGNIGYVFSKRYKPRQVRRLRKLHVDEISSVPVGANSGARVVFTKREDSTMDHHPITIAKQAQAAFSNGQLSERRFAEIQKSLALSIFPSETTEGRALARFFNTVVGKAMLAARPRLSTAENYNLMKSESGDNDGDDDDGAEQSPAYQQLCSRAQSLMASPAGAGMSFQQAFAQCASQPSGRVLIEKDKLWNMKRSQTAQAQG